MLENSSGMAMLAVDAASGAPLLRAAPLVSGALWGTIYDVAADGAAGVVLSTGAGLVALQP